MPESDSSQPFSYELEVLTLVNNEGEGFDIRKVFLALNYLNLLLKISYLESVQLLMQLAC